mmetsp:Transcript_74236/g.215092  ORF Transcript_74236/g.215092 Transcript_74236/m.215092 type:complete len:223 (-) Transcript_74236:1184-1852(-)
MLVTSGQLQGVKDETELSFIVQEPREIIDLSKPRSFNCKECMYRIISVSEWMLLKMFCCRNGVVRTKASGKVPVTAMPAAAVGLPDPAPAALTAATRAITSSSRCVSSKLADTCLPSASTRRFIRCASSLATTSFGLAGDTSNATVSKKLSALSTSHPTLPTSRVNNCAKACTFRAMCFKPSDRWYTAYIAAMLASNTCAVQTLDVALSKRMCCSRVCSVSR